MCVGVCACVCFCVCVYICTAFCCFFVACMCVLIFLHHNQPLSPETADFVLSMKMCVWNMAISSIREWRMRQRQRRLSFQRPVSVSMCHTLTSMHHFRHCTTIQQPRIRSSLQLGAGERVVQCCIFKAGESALAQLICTVTHNSKSTNHCCNVISLFSSFIVISSIVLTRDPSKGFAVPENEWMNDSFNTVWEHQVLC